mmetsp:Transcript_9702/g.16198  ORF Transcript_9702/g.16198 Transcript_9702/m.16198 type:complete len:303 (+) Transcript_9702:39-947(+)
MSAKEAQAPVYENTNGVPLCNGKNLHMDVGLGDIANRIITVGSESRAEKIAASFDGDELNLKRIKSSRGFTTITGTFNGVPVSTVAIGMGPAMMDFFVRETRAVVEGPMAIIRYGTCGGLTEAASAGSIVVATDGSGYISRNPDAFAACYSSGSASVSDSADASSSTAVDDDTAAPSSSSSLAAQQAPKYRLAQIAPANKELSELMISSLKEHIPDDVPIRTGANVTADSFYSSQGRLDPAFDDGNLDIADIVKAKYPTIQTMEMETFFLLHLAACCKVPIKAAAAAIVVANRPTGKVLNIS